MKEIALVLSAILMAATTVLSAMLLSIQGIPSQSFGGVTVGNEYRVATTTSQLVTTGSYLLTGTSTSQELNQNRTYSEAPGVLGSVIISEAGTANFVIYDATTSCATCRAASMATSTLRVLASFGRTPLEGTYVYDTPFTYGLLMDVLTATNFPTTTITWRR